MNNFKDRISNNPNRRKMTILNSDGTTTTQLVDIERCDEEDVIQAGTELNAENLNKLMSFEKSLASDIPGTNDSKLAKLVIDADNKPYVCPPNNGEVIPLSIPAGGTKGQVLTKIDDTNYNAKWSDSTGGMSYVYKCNGVNDNEVLSGMANDFLTDSNGISNTLYIKGSGVFGAGQPVAKGAPIVIADEIRAEIDMYKGNIRWFLSDAKYQLEHGILEMFPDLFDYYPSGYSSIWSNLVGSLSAYILYIEENEAEWEDYIDSEDDLMHEVYSVLDRLITDAVNPLSDEVILYIGIIKDLIHNIYNDYRTISDALIRLEEAESNHAIRYDENDALIYLQVLNPEFSGKRIIFDMEAVDFTQAVYSIPQDAPNLPLAFARLANCEFKGNVKFHTDCADSISGLYDSSGNIIKGDWNIASSGVCKGMLKSDNNIIKGNWQISSDGECIGVSDSSDNVIKGNWSLTSLTNSCIGFYNIRGFHRIKGDWRLEGEKTYGIKGLISIDSEDGMNGINNFNVKDGEWNLYSRSDEDNSAAFLFGTGQYYLDNLTINLFSPVEVNTAIIHSGTNPTNDFSSIYVVNNCEFVCFYISTNARALHITGSRMIVTNCRFHTGFDENIIPTSLDGLPQEEQDRTHELNDYVVYANNIKICTIQPWIESDFGGF